MQNWVKIKTTGRVEFNTSYQSVKVTPHADGYSYAQVNEAEGRDLCIRHGFKKCQAPPCCPDPAGEKKAPVKAKKAPVEEAPAPKRRGRRSRKPATES